ncbi:MAG: nucleotidyl transferase AbiEii/AbiGii toxin family protein [Planctomycetota bacterium]|nr:nucleotidyl transferase AbiEii/AbiGii toxin family protein [Planctomycetota bacterium]MDA1141159.1 nucleotidyl transferase AbiEii/AbiGii toxin family protein [Planctomycetota bacterium]
MSETKYERIDAEYEEQLRLVLNCLPAVAGADCFALKGGTAINLFLHDMPRVSVDIDLTYLPITPRDEALRDIEKSLKKIMSAILETIDDVRVHETRIQNRVTKLTANTPSARIKIEPNLLLRGTLGEPVHRDLCAAAQDHFGLFCSVPVVSDADIYGGKLCAALDRQHPRDFFDVKLLLDGNGISPEIRRAFVVYLAGHNRPMEELLDPNIQDISAIHEAQFAGMTRLPVALDELIDIQRTLAPMLLEALDANERQFLLSMKSGDPDWNVLGFKNLQSMPALQWKLLNIRKMEVGKRRDQLAMLKSLLE